MGWHGACRMLLHCLVCFTHSSHVAWQSCVRCACHSQTHTRVALSVHKAQNMYSALYPPSPACTFRTAHTFPVCASSQPRAANFLLFLGVVDVLCSQQVGVQCAARPAGWMMIMCPTTGHSRDDVVVDCERRCIGFPTFLYLYNSCRQHGHGCCGLRHCGSVPHRHCGRGTHCTTQGQPGH